MRKRQNKKCIISAQHVYCSFGICADLASREALLIFCVYFFRGLIRIRLCPVSVNAVADACLFLSWYLSRAHSHFLRQLKTSRRFCLPIITREWLSTFVKSRWILRLIWIKNHPFCTYPDDFFSSRGSTREMVDPIFGALSSSKRPPRCRDRSRILSNLI